MQIFNPFSAKMICLILTILISHSNAFGQVLECKELKEGISENYWIIQAVGFGNTSAGTQGTGTVSQHKIMSAPDIWADKPFNWKFEKAGPGCQLNFKLAMTPSKILEFQIPREAPIESGEKIIVTTKIPTEEKKRKHKSTVYF